MAKPGALLRGASWQLTFKVLLKSYAARQSQGSVSDFMMWRGFNPGRKLHYEEDCDSYPGGLVFHVPQRLQHSTLSGQGHLEGGTGDPEIDPIWWKEGDLWAEERSVTRRIPGLQR